MSRVSIHVTDRNGRQVSIAGEAGWSLMETMKSHGLPVAGTCGGAKVCSTCHVFVTEGYERVGAPDEDEQDLLDESSHVRASCSRLACQIRLDAALTDLEVELAPADQG